MTETRIRLVTRGDDSGSCHSANVAVLDAFEQGILRNTSLMVPAPAFEGAAEMYAGLDGLCVGLHATVTAEWDDVKWGPVLPAEEVPTLVDENGHFYATTQLVDQMGCDPDEMMAEIQAQLDLAREKGLQIDYVDSHMAFGWIRGMEERMAEFARSEGLIPRGVVQYLPAVDGSHENPVQELIARLDAAPPGTYMFVGHPGYDREDMRRFGHGGEEPGRVARERDWQRRVFMDPEIVEYCENNGVEPVRFTDVAGD